MAGSAFSTHDIVNVFRTVANLIRNFPELLASEGVFRVGVCISVLNEHPFRYLPNAHFGFARTPVTESPEQ